MNPRAKIKLALLQIDAREAWREYDKPVPYFGTAPEALLQGLIALPDLEVHVVSCIQKVMVCPEKLAPNVWYHGLLVPKLGWLRTGYQGCIRAVRRKLKEIRPDIVHGQGTERDCALSAVFSGFPNVVTIHGNMAELARLFRPRPFTYGWLAARLENFALARTAGVFCNSEYTEGLVRPRTPKTWRVPNAIRGEFFAPPARSRAADRCVIINIGSVMPRKRQVELLAVAKTLHERGCRFEWQFIGAADAKDEYCARFLAEVGVAEQQGYARHLGLKNTAQLIECLDEAHGMVHFPSEEAFGLVVVEALARGVKFFGSRLGGIVDLAGGSPGAELMGANDFAGLADALARWMGQGHGAVPGSSESIRRLYHPRAVAERHLEIYREVLSTAR